MKFAHNTNCAQQVKIRLLDDPPHEHFGNLTYIDLHAQSAWDPDSYLHRFVVEFAISQDVWDDMFSLINDTKFNSGTHIACGILSILKTPYPPPDETEHPRSPKIPFEPTTGKGSWISPWTYVAGVPVLKTGSC
ncbi:hypothetical protein BS50DRAFT_582321 [Corynespora cassiicola Philippines]|uniref:Uncharacterized protein n=1 Tax=Corynespora cassiicola Philippines TaxID=1448308 RepID=A0A2T2PDH8_CORCC|nr:hypothetical protein BS50DRAFT_582321 [Corynespora cassiicola Philippines]